MKTTMERKTKVSAQNKIAVGSITVLISKIYCANNPINISSLNCLIVYRVQSSPSSSKDVFLSYCIIISIFLLFIKYI